MHSYPRWTRRRLTLLPLQTLRRPFTNPQPPLSFPPSTTANLALFQTNPIHKFFFSFVELFVSGKDIPPFFPSSIRPHHYFLPPISRIFFSYFFVSDFSIQRSFLSFLRISFYFISVYFVKIFIKCIVK